VCDFVRYGYFSTNNRYFFCYQVSTMKSIFQEISLGNYPTACGQHKIVRIRDLQNGYDSGEPDQKAKLPRSSYMVTYFFENGAVITVRGSGTEPKLKYYAELRGEYSQKEQVDAMLADTLHALIHDLLKPEANGLKVPTD
jgi:phosphomannomutase